jgi:hypothetical protein
MWKGTAEILNAKPTSSSPSAIRIIGLPVIDCAERYGPTADSRVLPVTP